MTFSSGSKAPQNRDPDPIPTGPMAAMRKEARKEVEGPAHTIASLQPTPRDQVRTPAHGSKKLLTQHHVARMAAHDEESLLSRAGTHINAKVFDEEEAAAAIKCREEADRFKAFIAEHYPAYQEHMRKAKAYKYASVPAPTVLCGSLKDAEADHHEEQAQALHTLWKSGGVRDPLHHRVIADLAELHRAQAEHARHSAKVSRLRGLGDLMPTAILGPTHQADANKRLEFAQKRFMMHFSRQG